MPRTHYSVTRDAWDPNYLAGTPSPMAGANRRRLRVFLGVFVLSCIASLSYTFLRPAIYRAVARIEVTPASSAPSPISISTTPGNVNATDEIANEKAGGNRPILTAIEVLSSRPVLVQAIEQLKPHYDLSSLGADAVTGLQSGMLITPVSGTNVMELAITGRDAEILAPLLNAVIGGFQASQDADYGKITQYALTTATDEVAKLAASVDTKQREVELFSLRHDITSPERGENQVLASVAGLSTSLSKATENVELAEGKLHSLRDAAAAGTIVLQPKDDPTLASMQESASELRQDLAHMAVGLTPEFLDKDPVARAKRTQLADLAQQIKAERVVGQQAAVAAAEQELESARETVKALQQQNLQNRSTVRKFSADFDRYKALQDDLIQMQALYRAAAERKLRLEASELERMPQVNILEAATVPLQAWRPLYMRDAAIAVAGSFLLGLLAMWFIELFNRPEPRPAFIITQPVNSAGVLTNRPGHVPLLMPELQAAGPANLAYLTGQPNFPRELRQDEITALLKAGSDSSRLSMLLLLSGVRPEEALLLTLDDVDLLQRRIRIGGERARELSICETLATTLAHRRTEPGQPLVCDAHGHTIGVDQLHADFLCAAHDAGLAAPAEITPASLWHTYVAYLVRQGIRFADLMRITGPVPTETMASYSELSPTGPRVPLEAIQPVLPAMAQMT
jgi:polysaccharide biosynthesis transport protein